MLTLRNLYFLFGRFSAFCCSLCSSIRSFLFLSVPRFTAFCSSLFLDSPQGFLYFLSRLKISSFLFLSVSQFSAFCFSLFLHSPPRFWFLFLSFPRFSSKLFALSSSLLLRISSLGLFLDFSLHRSHFLFLNFPFIIRLRNHYLLLYHLDLRYIHWYPQSLSWALWIFCSVVRLLSPGSSRK